MQIILFSFINIFKELSYQLINEEHQIIMQLLKNHLP